jgi:hypothetical protein
MDADGHRRCRELLGPYVLGHLDAAEVEEVDAHCLTCEACRDDLAEIAPVAGTLPPRGSRPRAGPTMRDLEEQVVRSAHRRRHRPRRLAAVASLVLLVGIAVGVTQQLGTPDQGLGVREAVAAVRADGVVVSEASVMPHTWGTEVFFTVEGLEDGATYEVVLIGRDGEEVDAGTLIGDSTLPVVCVMNGAKLREDVRAFEVRRADDGAAVVISDLQAYTPGEA